jgi:ABC-type amino acid transport substrate-binding protein
MSNHIAMLATLEWEDTMRIAHSLFGLALFLGLTSAAFGQAADVKESCSAEKSPTIKAIQERGVLNWATGIAPPFAAKDASGKYVGIEAENAEELAKILGVKVNIHDYSYDLLPPTLASGAADIVGAALYITDKRKEVIDFSDVYQREGSIYFVLADRNDLNSLEDLNKPSVTVIANLGSGYVDLTRKVLPDAKLITADQTTNPGIRSLMVGQADASITSATELPLQYKAAPEAKIKLIGKRGVVNEEIPSQEDLIEPFDVGFGVKKDDSGWLACINAWVKEGVESGRFRERYVRWVKKIAES